MPAETTRTAQPGVGIADALDLLAYLVTAADLCTREPLHYGMFRLIDAAGRLAGGLEAGGAAADRPWIHQLHADIEANKQLLMWDRPAFELFLHDAAAKMGSELAADRLGSRIGPA